MDPMDLLSLFLKVIASDQKTTPEVFKALLEYFPKQVGVFWDILEKPMRLQIWDSLDRK